MANYNLTINSTFDPFTYEQMAAPVLLATLAHLAVEEAYGELDTKALYIAGKINSTTDPEAYKQYLNYYKDLKQQADILATRGLLTSSRNNMLKIRGRYANEILTIEDAFKRKLELQEELRKTLAADPTRLYQRMANTMSLDEFLKDPNADYGQQYSGATLTAQVASAAERLSIEARDSEEGRRELRLLIPYQYELVRQRGFSSGEILKAIQNSDNSNEILNGIVNSVLDSSGVNIWGDEVTKLKALNYAKLGLWKAIGETTYDNITDQAGLTRLLYDLQDRNARRSEARVAKAASESTGGSDAPSGSIPIDLHNLLSSNMLGKEAAEKALDSVKFLGKDLKTGKVAKYIGKNFNFYNTAIRTIHKGDLRIDEAHRRTRRFYKIQLWKDNGSALTRYQFMQLGLTADDKRALGELYDTTVKKHFANLGIDVDKLAKLGKVTTITKISKNYWNLNKESGPFSMKAVLLGMKKDEAKNLLEGRIVPLMRHGNRTTLTEIESFDRAGNIKDTGKIVKVGDILDKEGKALDTPLFYASPNPNTKGIIMAYNGKQYLLPFKKLGSIANGTYAEDVPELMDMLSLRQQLINLVGQAAYLSSPEGRQIEEALNNRGAAYIRTMYNSIGWSGQLPTYNIAFNSQTQTP